jgi:hypothetical protein
MKITLTYEAADVDKIIRQMLAAKGLQPDEENGRGVVFELQENDMLNIVVDCKEGPLVSKCPACGHDASAKPTAVAVPSEPTRKTTVTTKKPKPEPVVEEVIVDEELGESTEPPTDIVSPVDEEEEEEVDENGDPVPSMSSIRGVNERLLIERTREREAALKKSRETNPTPTMPGESTRPPKAGA